MSSVSTIEGLAVDVRRIVFGSMDNNIYIVSDGQGTMVVDPSCRLQTILDVLDGATVDAIVLTHSHYDHVTSAAALRKATGAPVIASLVDAPEIIDPSDVESVPCPVDRTIDDGDIVQVGGMEWATIMTPGHTPGSISLFLDPCYGNHPQGCPVLISGDTLFAGTTGRTDFEGGSSEDMRASLKKLVVLPDDTVVLPGHNGLTTIGDERAGAFAYFGIRKSQR